METMIDPLTFLELPDYSEAARCTCVDVPAKEIDVGVFICSVCGLNREEA
jgi:hypothetical protein